MPIEVYVLLKTIVFGENQKIYPNIYWVISEETFIQMISTIDILWKNSLKINLRIIILQVKDIVGNFN